MPTQLQLRRGTTAQNNAFTGAAGELSYDTTVDTIRVHDGTTAGGFEMVTTGATQTLTNKTLTSPTITGTGAIAGTFTGNVTGDVTGNAATATTATNVTVTANNTANETVYITFVDGATGTQGIETDTNLSYNPSTNVLSTTASAAQYADLAERYTSDSDYGFGTVLVFGGEEEVTQSTSQLSRRIAGVVSVDPAYLMNSELQGGVNVALVGRVPCKVVGPVVKGDMMVSSATPGHAQAWNDEGDPPMGTVIGKALENKTVSGEGVIEVVVGRM